MGGITQQRNTTYINLKDYCKIDGVSDDSFGFTNAYQLATSLGKGLFHPGGTLVKGNDTIVSTVPIIGIGSGASVFKLKNGANSDLFSAQTGSINLAAANNTGIQGTVSRFAFQGLTLDGNKANQTAGQSYPLRFYAYNYTLRDLEILNGYSGGFQSDWNYGAGLPSPSDQMESVIENIKLHDNNGIGFQMGGPHDSRIDKILSFVNGSHNFHFAPNMNGAQVSDCHAYSPPNIAGTCNWLIEIPFGCNFINCISDGGSYTGVAIIGSNVTWQGQIYNSAQAGSVGIQLGQTGGNTPFPGQILQSAGVTTAVGASQVVLLVNLNGFPGGALKLQNESNNFILANIQQTTGTPISGNFAASDTYHINVVGQTPDGTVSKSGGMRVVSSANPALSVLDNGGTQRFHIDSSSGGTSGVDVPGNFHINATGGIAFNIAPNSSFALFGRPTADNQTGLALSPNSVNQTSPLLAITNESFVNKFTVDKNGNAIVSGIITPSGGVGPVHTGFTSFATGGAANLLNASSGASITTAAGTIYWAALWIPFNVTLTGVILSVGAVGGTDLWIGALYDYAGNLLANSTLSGITAGVTGVKQKLPFTAPIVVVGPSVFYIALQSNGATASFRAFSNLTEGFVTGSANNTFGTLTNPIAPGTTYTASLGPFASTY